MSCSGATLDPRRDVSDPLRPPGSPTFIGHWLVSSARLPVDAPIADFIDPDGLQKSRPRAPRELQESPFSSFLNGLPVDVSHGIVAPFSRLRSFIRIRGADIYPPSLAHPCLFPGQDCPFLPHRQSPIPTGSSLFFTLPWGRRGQPIRDPRRSVRARPLAPPRGVRFLRVRF
jgi:hypothetical protein